jgi:N-formylmaleamate deformylase
MSASRRTAVAILTLFLTAVFSSFAWPEDKQPHSFRAEVSGRGRPMILIPGLASSGETWKTTVARYRDRYECHVLTLAGFAGAPPIAEPLLASVRAELVDYIRDRHLDRPIIVGHSLGGTLALAVAADHPDLVGPLVIVDSLPFLGGTVMQAKDVAAAKPGIAAMRAYMSALTDAQWGDYIRSGAATDDMVSAAADREVLKRWSAASDKRAVIDAMADLYAMDLRDDAARITSATLVLGTWAGLHEQLKQRNVDVPRTAFVQTFSDQFSKLPHMHFAMADAARHFIMFDDPSWFFEQLDAFLREPDAVVNMRGFDGK